LNQLKNIVEEVFDLYQNFGNQDYIGEPVSQIEHMSQAAELAMLLNSEDEVILAAFFHDIGHLVDSNNEQEKMGGFGVAAHEDLGAQYLQKKGFSSRIIKLVKGHVEAKRYLTYKFPDYYQKLSEASKMTLKYQGGIMTETEALNFEQDPDKELMILFRKWDDEAKLENKKLIDLQILKQKALLHLKKQPINL
jgi:phosphonate degradation associated HDIG domain protein